MLFISDLCGKNLEVLYGVGKICRRMLCSGLRDLTIKKSVTEQVCMENTHSSVLPIPSSVLHAPPPLIKSSRVYPLLITKLLTSHPDLFENGSCLLAILNISYKNVISFYFLKRVLASSSSWASTVFF